MDKLAELEAAARAAGIEDVIGPSEIREWLNAELVSNEEERQRFGHAPEWSFLLADASTPAMYVLARELPDATGVSVVAGIGDPRVLREYSDEWFGRPYDAAIAALAALEGGPFWKGELTRADLQ